MNCCKCYLPNFFNVVIQNRFGILYGTALWKTLIKICHNFIPDFQFQFLVLLTVTVGTHMKSYYFTADFFLYFIFFNFIICTDSQNSYQENYRNYYNFFTHGNNPPYLILGLLPYFVILFFFRLKSFKNFFLLVLDMSAHKFFCFFLISCIYCVNQFLMLLN